MSDYESLVPKPQVRRKCKRCLAALKAQHIEPGGSVMLMHGRFGIEHEQAFGDPVTLCGIQADGEQWWWEA